MSVLLAGIAIGVAIGVFISSGSGVPKIMPRAEAAGGKVESPTGVAPDRYVYDPGTEALKKDEVRVICCGSGMPAARHGQAACAWLIECGNGEKLIFDLGTGSMANVAALMIPYQYLDKVFLSQSCMTRTTSLSAVGPRSMLVTGRSVSQSSTQG